MVTNSLLDFATRPVVAEPRKPPAERFSEWLALNEHIYRLFARFAAEARAAGRKRIGAKEIMERIRWHCTVETHTDKPDDYKLNNDFTPYLARKLVADDPTFSGYFEMRRLHE